MLTAVATVGTISGCSAKNDDSAPSASATLINHDEIVKAVADLSAAIDDLTTNIGAFDSDDWKTVVPNVKNAADAVETRSGASRL